ncbi:hypothetical protein ACFOYU_10445 [Microvirga sp. GCM10011540]|uniref:hypothetical protein n=1 Tax=Microvirga sp. GCM10011540 TaxID=3317338 RepID=UPI003607A6C8
MPVDIKLTTLQKARKDQAAGKVLDITDSRARGLVLRVKRRSIQWTWKAERDGRTFRLVLGDCDPDQQDGTLLSIAEARDLAEKATTDFRAGRGVPKADWLEIELERLGKIVPLVKASPGGTFVVPAQKPMTTREAFAWSYEAAVRAYLRHVEATSRPATLADYRKTLTCPALRPLMREQVRSIRVDRIQEVLNKLALDGKQSQAEAIFRKVRTFWAWLARPAIRDKSMVAKDALDDLHKPERRRRRDGEAPRQVKYFPPMEEIGLILAIARSGALDPVYAAASTLLLATGQRNHAVVSARQREFEHWDEQPGWGVWRVPPLHRKGAAREDEEGDIPHAIPLPPAVWEAVMGQMERAGESEWLFPALRPRREGMPSDHLSESALTHLWGVLPGVKASPHDVRRALRTHGRKILKIRPIDLSLILDHSEGRMHIVTERHYSDDDMLDVKQPIITEWWALVERHAKTEAVMVRDGEEVAARIKRARAEKRRAREAGRAAA